MESHSPLRRPEYTGDRRCPVCTVLNLGIAGWSSANIAVLVEPVLGLVAFVVGCVLVYLRGYLIPGTPVVAERLFPACVHPDRETSTEGAGGEES